MVKGRLRVEAVGKQKVGFETKKEIWKGFGALNLPEAPVFYPTAEEFKDPLGFIAKIRPVAEPYGLCRIVPPESWKPPFALDPQSFCFPTKLQAIHQLQERPAACNSETFKLEYDKYLQTQGRTLGNWPLFCGEELDLCKLFNSVKRHGGCDKVIRERKWGEVLRMVRPDDASSLSSAAPSNLCHLYEKHLYGYEISQTKEGHSKENIENPQAKTCSKEEESNTKKEESNTPVGECSTILKEENIALGSETSPLGRKRQLVSESEVTGLETSTAELPEGEGCKRAKLESKSSTDVQLEKVEQLCEQCHIGAHEQMMISCDRCDRRWHLYCLSPPLSAVPSGNWYCLDCVASEQDSFGFGQGHQHNLESFRRMSERFKKQWFGGRSVSHSEIEQHFWQVVEGSNGPVDVLYGSDLDTSIYGSGFPRHADNVPRWAKDESWREHVKSPWNLNNFPKLNGSLLKLVDENIPGVIVPWVYIGMLFSSFCWHYEDHCLYSVNYLHWGDAKCWYSIPGSAYEAFEEVMRSTFPDLFEAQPDLLFQLVTMLNPSVLREKGVPVCTTLQEAGNFVITFPRSYHGGFNEGFNCAEAVNFAPVDWLPYGRFGIERNRIFHKAAVLSQDELLCVVAKNDYTAVSSSWFQEDLRQMIVFERNLRAEVWRNGTVKSSRMPARSNKSFGSEEDPECIICRYFLHVSAVTCKCRPGKAVCLQHARQLCECDAGEQCLLYRYSLSELEDLLVPAFEESGVGEICKEKSELEQKGPAVDSTLSKKVNGYVVTHVELAERWVSETQTIIESPLTLSAIENMLLEAEQFLWAGHEMDVVRSLVSILDSARNWAKDVAACYTIAQERLCGGKVRKLSLRRARELVMADPPPCIESYLVKLKVLVEDACTLQQQISDCLASSAPAEVRGLQRLQQTALQSPFDFPEIQKLKDVLSFTQNWADRIKKVLSAGDEDIHQLRNLQSEGMLLPVMVAEKRLLDVAIRKVESWQHHASHLLCGSPTLQEAEEIVGEAEHLPVNVPEIETLKTHVVEAQSWVIKAQEALNKARTNKDLITTKCLEDVLEEHSSLKFQPADAELLDVELKKLIWMGRASKAIDCGTSSADLSMLSEQAAKLNINNDLVLKVHELGDASIRWEKEADSILRLGGSYDAYRDLTSAPITSTVKLLHLEEMKGVIQRADSWLECVRPFLNKEENHLNHHVGSPPIKNLKDLVLEVDGIPVLLNETKMLQDLLFQAEAWCMKATALQLSFRTMFFYGSEAPIMAPSENVKVDKPLPAEDGMLELKLQLNNTVQEGLELRLDIPELSALQICLKVTEWSLKALKSLHASPPIQELIDIYEDGEKIMENSEECCVFQVVKETICRAKSWLLQANKWLRQSPDNIEDISDMELMLVQAQNLHVDLRSEMSQISKVIVEQREWQHKQQLKCVLNRQAVDDAWAHSDCAEGTGVVPQPAIGSLEFGSLDPGTEKLKNVSHWLRICRNSLGIPSDHSVKDHLIQMEKFLLISLEKTNNKDVIRESSTCVCLRALDSLGDKTPSCVTCGDSYHGSCLGFTKGSKQYVCAYCTSLTTGNLGIKDGAFFEIFLTKRPAFETLLKLRESAKRLPSRLEEEDLLECIINLVHTWQARVSECVEPILVQQTKGFSVDLRSLVGALKAVSMLSVHVEESQRLRMVIAANAWRIRAAKLLEGSPKPLFRFARALKEALSIPVPPKDWVFQEIKKLESWAMEWVALAKKVIDDGGDAPLDEVHLLIAEGEKLPVVVSKELTALRERSVLYCICRKPYDEDRAMIACDRCGEWYHFTCIDLPEPKGNDVDYEEGIRDELGPGGEFFCPSCKEHGKTREHMQLLNSQSELRENAAAPIAKEAEIAPSLASTRGRRSSSRSQGKYDSNSPDDFLSWSDEATGMEWELNDASKDQEQPEECLNGKGRPCRRTAGRHRGFDSFVLLMRSR